MHPQTEGATGDRRQVGEENFDPTRDDRMDATRQEQQYGDQPAGQHDYRTAETGDPDRTTHGEPLTEREGYDQPIGEHEHTRPAGEHEQASEYADSAYGHDRPSGAAGYTEPEPADRPVDFRNQSRRDEPVAQERTERAPQADDEWRLFTAENTDSLRSRWAELQGSFVDDPRQAVEQAEGLVSEVVETIADRFSERKKELQTQGVTDTEQLRLAMRRYRTFFTMLLGG